ncbi:MAG: hypothetical protein EOP19_30785 [Hyphomicrobiales bacterium]|nr:MAG: hypothetical protein EOP19_30785 [Hyphomicrobiales bacterium]
MPTLIRLVVILLVLAGLAYGAMFGLVAMVDPGEKDVTVRIPARDLIASPERAPVVRREIDTTRVAPAAEPAGAAPTPGTGEPLPAPAAPPAEDGTVVTVAPRGVE